MHYFHCLFFFISIAYASEKWFEQNLDHFNYENHKSWNQRYFASDAYYRSGGPAFLMIGGEGPESPVWLEKGHWVDIAKEVGAMCFILEHRYYGESHPTPDTKVENLQYLTSEQALADLARFITNMTIDTGIKKWITFGGSYPGSLSLWAKLKYPHLIQGAMSASAPLLAKMDFFEYNEVVDRSLETYGGSKCVESISIATSSIKKLLVSDDGRKELMKTFNLCEPLAKNDDQYFQNSLADSIAETVQYNRDNRAFEGAANGNVTISVVCDHMTDASLGNELQRYATLSSLFTEQLNKKRLFRRRFKKANKNGGDKCMDASYQNFINELKIPTFNAERTWFFQTCTEFGWFQSTDSTKQPFHGFPVGLFTDMCEKVLGSAFSPKYIQSGIDETNVNYCAKGVAEVLTNAYLFNGGIDPWHAMSFVSSTESSVKKSIAKLELVMSRKASSTFHTIFVPSSAHCAIMYPSSPEDPPELTQARALAAKYVKSWL